MRPVSVPISRVEPVTDVLHGVQVTDPYRWLEDQNSPETRAWIEEQTRHARTYLDNLPGRERIRERVRELLDVETYDSFLKAQNRYFFRKRLRGQEQPSIYFREGAEGEDQLLIDPASRGTGNYTAVKPLRVSSDGCFLLYETKQGGERMGRFEIIDLVSRRTLPDSLPYGYLRGFAFAPDHRSFYYVHEAYPAGSRCRAVYQHLLGTPLEKDREIFCAGEEEHIRLVLVAGAGSLGLMVYRFLEKTLIDFYLFGMDISRSPVPILKSADYSFSPRLSAERILASVNQKAPNSRIVEVQPRRNQDPLFLDIVPENDAFIQGWFLTRNHIVVSYRRSAQSHIEAFDHFGNHVAKIVAAVRETIRVVAADPRQDEIFVEKESFADPIETFRCVLPDSALRPWARRDGSLSSDLYAHTVEHYESDGASIPIHLFGKRTFPVNGPRPAVMTSYGGYGISATPRYSALVAFLVEKGCLFALPAIRGGSDFGTRWHQAAIRRDRQVAFDDFIAAAEWLIQTGRTTGSKHAIFGGSNSGLLVAVAMTQRPDLFCAVLCIAPLLDMLRYHFFDEARLWKEEFGTAEDPNDFVELAKYSPYHAVRDGVAYPSIMIVSGDADQKCNASHARKMTARMQAAGLQEHPVLLDYDEFRGHSPVLPLTTRINALTDRLAFLSAELELEVKEG